MRIALTSAVFFALAALALPDEARADVCDGAASGGCNWFCTAGDSVLEIQDTINGAPAGSNVCLARGQTFSSGTGVNVRTTAGTAAAWITVCASSNGAGCTDSGAANPRIVVTGTNAAGILFGPNVDYVEFRHIDLDGNARNDVNEHTGIDFSNGTPYGSNPGINHVRFVGGVVQNWMRGWISDPWWQSAPPSNIELGTCQYPLTVRRTNRDGGYGWFANSTLAIKHSDTGRGNVFDHNIYLSSGAQPQALMANNVLECGDYTDSSLAGTQSVGSFIHFAGRAQGLKIRNNRFHDDSCGTWVLDFDTANDISPEYFIDVEISGNVFETPCPISIYGGYLENARIFNNVFRTTAAGTSAFINLFSTSTARAAAGGSWIYNNTFYCDSSTCPDDWVRVDASQDDTNRFYNNVMASPRTNLSLLNAACARFGGGAELASNFVHAPGDSTPGFPSCSGTGNSTSFTTDPKFVAAGAADFRLASGSPLAGHGRTTGAPATDIAGAARPNPPSAGAYDLGGGGSAPIPAAPILLP